MRPSTPNFDFSQQAGPSSPPQTPTTCSGYTFLKNHRQGHVFNGQQIPIPPGNGSIVPNGPGNSFSYRPSHGAAELSPRSSSPDSVQSPVSGSPSLSKCPSSPASAASPRRRPVRVAEGSFTIDEVLESDHDGFEIDEVLESDHDGFEVDEDSVIRPYEYEDAASDRSSIKRKELDPDLYSRIQNLHCANDDVIPEPDLKSPNWEAEREIWAKRMKAQRRRRRMKLGVRKRTLTESMGSDTDDEDIQPATFEGATSARRLRRKTESLTLDDPPPRIDEVEEPESCEELVDIDNDMLPDGFRELPYYYVQEDMDLDSHHE